MHGVVIDAGSKRNCK